MPDANDRTGSTLPARLLFGFAVLNLLFLFVELGLNVGKALL
jgi:hypothetical protein